MKSSQQPQKGPPSVPKTQSLKENEGDNTGIVPRTQPGKGLKKQQESIDVAQSPQQVTSGGSMANIPYDINAIGVMRKRMSEALAQKQQKKSGTTPPVALLKSTSTTVDDVGDNIPTMSSEPPSAHSGTLSTDSARTVRAHLDATPGAVRTPSYPFPRMQMKLQRGISSRSGPHHKPFTLLSPTSDPPDTVGIDTTPNQPASSELSTPVGNDQFETNMQDDPNYPTPDLYDMVLMLSSEPGLDSWWANVTEILSELYGAERASLALPGDITDLENVPWGQRATFNILGSDSGDSFAFGSNATSDVNERSLERVQESFNSQTDSPASVRRPPLESRHSIAGVAPDRFNRGPRQRPEAPTRAISFAPQPLEDTSGPMHRPQLTRQSPTPQFVPTLGDSDPKSRKRQDSTIAYSSAPRCHVWRSLQPLEQEPDSLLVRTGVASMFGKRKPVILTRAYSADFQSSNPGSRTVSEDGKSQNSSPRIEDQQSVRKGSQSSGMPLRAFDEFEQPEPSPWSQSPSPSPAARPDPEMSPFFTQTASVDEDAFQPNPPIYDYGATANQSLHAIGTDMSKTLIHIPLIQPVPSRSVMQSTLRFPVAILSFLTPINPYPRNLRHSMIDLLPHLASTFALAQQFSNLQDRLRGGLSRQSAAFGLGGTFSDEGSELELVSELSSQIVQDKDKSRNSSLHGSIYSPSEGTNVSKDSITGSLVGTPSLENLGFNTGYPSTPAGKSGSEMVDSYFLAKRHRGSQPPQTPGAKTSGEETPERSKRSEKSVRTRSSVKKTAGPTKLHGEPVITATSRPFNTMSEVDTGERPNPSTLDQMDLALQKSMIHRDSLVKIDSEKPLPELISSLMLNAVPLQLFLAKPSTGDLVWTNRKFDAFRSQGEGRVRDPWKNVHTADQDGLIKSWKEALKTGSQFTHYVRVKRFNSDSDFRWFVFRASTLLSNNGRLLYWIGSFLDVHEQYIKNLEANEKEATRARDAKIRALADAIPQILFEAVEGEGIVSVNQQWHTFAGQTLDEARGLGFARHVHREDLYKCGILSPSEAKAVISKTASESDSSTSSKRTAQPQISPKSIFTPDTNSLEVMLNQGALLAETDENGRTSYSTEIRLRSKGGEFRWHLIRLVKVQHELLNGGRASWYGTCTDIETRMSLERDLNHANKKVNQEMESKTKFFANMSHEIRTPLNGILGSMPWLVESQLDHDQRRTVDTIQNSANNLRELVDNILDVTKVEAGKMTLIPKWFHVRSLCEEVVDTVSSRAIERGLELNYSLDVDVPTMVKGDPFRVRQVLLNLMGNAVKFTEQGEVYMHCHFKKTLVAPGNAPEGLLSFDIVDTGRGFNGGEFKRLFKQFGQIEGANQHESGSGLGLFLSKQLVEMHGGELSVKSKAGEGSTFSFYVRVEPSLPGSDIASPSTTERPKHRHSVSVGSSMRSRSDSQTPTMPASQSIVHTPGLSKYVSPEARSPSVLSPNILTPVVSPDSSVASMRSNSGNILQTSSISSLLPTPESVPGQSVLSSSNDRQQSLDDDKSILPIFKRSKSDNDGRGIAPDLLHPEMYSIVVICPAEHARTAIKQHIEHVVPHQIPANVTALKDIGTFLNLMHGPGSPTFTHIVLNLPASSDIMLFMRQMNNFTAPIIPALVVITDHYQKRDIQEDFAMLTSGNRKAFLVHKPVKPSVFAMIFDPAQLRKLSKDRAREVAQTSSDDFKRISNQVKETIGNKAFRILLVEDSDVNRMVIMRYLKRVGLSSDEARDGQECIDKVTARPHGYYSLIICDIQMPRKNGYQACTELRAWETAHGYRPSPIMALTANAMPEERAAAGSAGFTDYLTKPVDFNRLGTLMMSLLDVRTPHVFLRDQPAEEDLSTQRR